MPDTRGGPGSIAVNSGSDSLCCTPESGNIDEPSLPKDSSSPCDAAIDMISSAGEPNEMPARRRPLDAALTSELIQNRAGCNVKERGVDHGY
jgi:hypothetical protein